MRLLAPSLTLALLLVSGSLFAYDYRVPIRVQDENDLEELFLSGDLTEEERDQLLELYRSPLDINSASRDELYLLPGLTYDLVDRIIAYRETKPFFKVNDLVLVEGIDASMVRELRAFASAHRPKAKGPAKSPWHGTMRLRVVDEVGDKDELLPEGYFRGEVRHKSGWAGGAVLLLQNKLDGLEYRDVAQGDMPATVWAFDPNGNPKTEDGGLSPSETKTLDRFLYSEGRTPLPAWPKVYASYKGDRVNALVGSYRIGFGQRLVLDNTGRLNPHGFEPDLQIYEEWDDLTLTKGFFGAAVTGKNIFLGPLEVDATGFFSWWKYDSYQYDVKHDTGEPGENQYESYKVVEPYKSMYYKELYYQTLPEAYSELLGGANVSVKLMPGLRWGFTGYASTVDFQLGDSDTVFARASPFPTRKTFGAAGTDVAWQLGPWQAWGEAAWVDSGGVGAVAKGMYDFKPVTVELLYRYYGRDFDNPHSRGYNMPDEWLGDRDRGENGFRGSVRYRATKSIWLRADADIWRAAQDKENAYGVMVAEDPWRMEEFVRIDWRATSWLQLGAFAQFNDRDLEASGRDEVYSASGEKWSFGASSSLDFQKFTTLWLYYKMSMYDAGLEDGSFQKDHYVTAKLSTRVWEWLRLQGRVKYLKGELESMQGVSREHYLEGYAQVGVVPVRRLLISLKGLVREHYDSAKETEWFWRLGADWSF